MCSEWISCCDSTNEAAPRLFNDTECDGKGMLSSQEVVTIVYHSGGCTSMVFHRCCKLWVIGAGQFHDVEYCLYWRVFVAVAPGLVLHIWHDK